MFLACIRQGMYPSTQAQGNPVAGTITVPVFARYKTIDYPRDAEGELSGMIHQNLQAAPPPPPFTKVLSKGVGP